MSKGKGKGKVVFYKCEGCLKNLPGDSFIGCLCGFEKCIECVENETDGMCPECETLFDIETVFDKMPAEWVDDEYMPSLDDVVYSSVFNDSDKERLSLLLISSGKEHSHYINSIDTLAPASIKCSYPMCGGQVRKDKDWVCVLCKEKTCKYCQKPRNNNHKCNKEDLDFLVKHITTHFPCIRCKNYTYPDIPGKAIRCSTDGCNLLFDPLMYRRKKPRPSVRRKPITPTIPKMPENLHPEDKCLVEVAYIRISEISKVVARYVSPPDTRLKLKLDHLKGTITKYKFKDLYYPEYIKEVISSKISLHLEWLSRRFSITFDRFTSGTIDIDEFLDSIEDLRNTFNDRMYKTGLVFGVNKYPYLAREWLLWTDVSRYSSPLEYSKLLVTELKELLKVVDVKCERGWKKADMVRYLTQHYPDGIHPRDIVVARERKLASYRTFSLV